MQSLGLDDGKFRMTFHPCRGEESGGAADRLSALGLVDRVLSEPLGGAHRDPKLMSMTLKKALVDELRGLLTLTKEELLARRAERLDHYGVFTTETPKKEA